MVAEIYPYINIGYRVGGWTSQVIMPLCGPILQDFHHFCSANNALNSSLAHGVKPGPGWEYLIFMALTLY